MLLCKLDLVVLGKKGLLLQIYAKSLEEGTLYTAFWQWSDNLKITLIKSNNIVDQEISAFISFYWFCFGLNKFGAW